MIMINIIDGPQRGIRLLGSEFKNPIIVFRHFLETDANWEIDYTFAANEEAVRWGLLDMLTRSIRALRNNRDVIVNGNSYICLSDKKEDIVSTVSSIEEELQKYCNRGYLRYLDNPLYPLIIFSEYIPHEWN